MVNIDVVDRYIDNTYLEVKITNEAKYYIMCIMEYLFSDIIINVSQTHLKGLTLKAHILDYIDSNYEYKYLFAYFLDNYHSVDSSENNDFINEMVAKYKPNKKLSLVSKIVLNDLIYYILWMFISNIPDGETCDICDVRYIFLSYAPFYMKIISYVDKRVYADDIINEPIDGVNSKKTNI